ncbi:MAG: Nuclease-related domain-containing protein [Candidatus Tokpelaia hoelldobleri]|uniref:Nuclease-related domain-containing protein n=1 Tax=Candidatus Tokpelaia hoelldobleri TaxID=1902579 RepID=A0A1U9JV75_9HYPH|nr:MAG: Nuclease-related domain-containing protein [Candidatus Tokpelaia hoelldoblerii]
MPIIIFCIISIFFIFLIIWGNRNKIFLEKITEIHRGTEAERDLILELVKAGFSEKEIFHDLYIKRFNGTFSQVDLVVLTEVGILVFEVKDYSGWIFGNGRNQQWTQVLAYGKEKYRFYNPIKQNYSHIVELHKKIGNFSKVPVYSIVVFYGDCELKDINFIPERNFVTKSERVMEVISHIINSNNTVDYNDKSKVIEILEDCVKNGENIETQIQHIENIKHMFDEDRVFR